MKQHAIFFLILVPFISCKEDMESDIETEVIEITLEGTESYEYKFSDTHPIEGGYDIRKQAQNAQKSKMNWATYHYQAKEGFKGNETVEIVLFGSPGDDNFKDYKKWTFKIAVK